MDYDDVNDLLSFDSNTDEVTEVVIITMDDVVEGAETFGLRVYNDEDRVLLVDDIASVRIADSNSMFTSHITTNGTFLFLKTSPWDFSNLNITRKKMYSHMEYLSVCLWK